MSVEIERKFLVPAVPEDIDLSAAGELRQGYLAEEGDVSVRVRVEPTGSTLTIKAGRGLRRTEVETPLTAEQVEALWPLTDGRRVIKRRAQVPVTGGAGGHVIDLDVYDGALAGLVTAEVEFVDEAAAARFSPPSWFGRELTDEPGWTNAALARAGRPDGGPGPEDRPPLGR